MGCTQAKPKPNKLPDSRPDAQPLANELPAKPPVEPNPQPAPVIAPENMPDAVGPILAEANNASKINDNALSPNKIGEANRL